MASVTGKVDAALGYQVFVGPVRQTGEREHVRSNGGLDEVWNLQRLEALQSPAATEGIERIVDIVVLH